MNSKKAITLLVLTTMLLAMVPMAPVSADLDDVTIYFDNLDHGKWEAKGEKGQTIEITSDEGAVASGYEVTVYWDRVQSWDGEKGHLNHSDAANDGSIEIWITVPEADAGEHTLWFTATDQEKKPSVTFTVISDCDISTASGLEGSKLYVDLWGFAANKDVAILLVEEVDEEPASFGTFGFESNDDDMEGEAVDPDEDDYDGTLEYDMIVPGTFILTIGANTFDDDDGSGPVGKIYSVAADEKCGSLNYITGEWSIDLSDTDATEDGVFSAKYDYFEDKPEHFYVITSTGVTDSLGSWEDRRITIPDDALPEDDKEKQYYVIGMDGKNNQAYDDFKIGATITLSLDEGPVGTKVEVSGEGYKGYDTVTCELWRNGFVEFVHIIDSDDKPYEIDSDGDFEFDIIIPGVSKKDDDYEIKVISEEVEGKFIEASSDFEVTGLADVSSEPAFGPQGSSIMLSGKNFQNIKDSKVKITLEYDDDYVATIKENVKVDSDGSFEVKCTIPTENDGSYDIKVSSKADTDVDFYISDTVEFRIGTIMVLLSKDESVVGDKIVLSGNGFTDDGEWNATLGDAVIFEEEMASDTGLLRVSGVDTPQFFVPQLQPGEYVITVWDVDAEITVETEFTVTEYTVLDFELLEAPNEFNISINGWNWPWVDKDSSTPINYEDEIDFILYNETDDWEMDVRMFGDPAGDEDNSEKAYLNGTGFINDAWWVVPKSNTLDKGTYTVNATIETDNDQEYIMQLEFVIGEVHKNISPRKTTFRILDTVNFKIQHTFGNDANQEIKGGDVKVYDPDGTLYWDGDKLNTWSKVDTWYEVPYSAQTAGGNPMILLDDAPIGTWTYKWRDKEGYTITEGTLNVETSEADIIGKQIGDLNQAIENLTGDITGVSESVAGLKTDINSAVQAAQAAVDASNAAIEAVNAGVAQSADAAAAAERASEAAGKAQEAAGSLTTLVYGAIGASLVAAIAAIISLMQISKRIAG